MKKTPRTLAVVFGKPTSWVHQIGKLRAPWGPHNPQRKTTVWKLWLPGMSGNQIRSMFF